MKRKNTTGVSYKLSDDALKILNEVSARTNIHKTRVIEWCLGKLAQQFPGLEEEGRLAMWRVMMRDLELNPAPGFSSGQAGSPGGTSDTDLTKQAYRRLSPGGAEQPSPGAAKPASQDGQRDTVDDQHPSPSKSRRKLLS